MASNQPVTYQTTEPITRVPLNASTRPWGSLIDQIHRGTLTYDTPYQRGDVWTEDQRILLIFSILSGTPIPALIIAERPPAAWTEADGELAAIFAVIDGKQRLTTVRMFMEGALAVPASWWHPGMAARTEDTPDGPYVRWDGLSDTGRGYFYHRPATTAEGPVDSVAEEAAIYLRVNGAGTPQTQDDMDRAASVAQNGE